MTFVSPRTLLADLGAAALNLKGVRATLINMPIREQARPNTAPIGPALLAARLRDFGAEATIVDLNAYRIHDAEAQARGLPNGRVLTPQEAEGLLRRTFDQGGDQHLIGLSGLITTLRWQVTVAAMVRRLQPQALLVSGGGLATEFREILMDWIPDLDAVAHSEGDDVILKIALDAKALHDKGPARAEAAGLLKPYFIGERGGRAKFLYHGDRPRSLDTLPFPAFDLMEKDVDGAPVLDWYLKKPVWGGSARNSSATPFDMQRSISTVSSRGCPFACRFCFRGAQGERNYGTRSAESLAAEMRHYCETYGVDFIGFADDNFMVHPGRIADLVPALRPLVRDYSLRWGAHGRLDEAADLRTDRQGRSAFSQRLRVDDMAEAGCVYIGFGAESASPAVLEEMGKGGFMLTNGTTRINGFDFPRTMVEGIRNTRRARIHGNCTWIMGYPGETLADLQTSVAFIAWQREDATAGLTPGTAAYDTAAAAVNTAMFVGTAYPGTDMFTHPQVRARLGETFGIHYDRGGRPVPDERLRHYVMELNDASKVLYGPDGRLLNFSAMSDDQFHDARRLVETGNIFDILDL